MVIMKGGYGEIMVIKMIKDFMGRVFWVLIFSLVVDWRIELEGWGIVCSSLG